MDAQTTDQKVPIDQMAPQNSAQYPVQDIVRLRDFLGYLIGNRESIERVLAASQLNLRGSLLFGSALVATVALARSYDTVSLQNEPHRLLGPFVASLLMCVILFLGYFFWIRVTQPRRYSPYPGGHFTKFLAGYWWTAPIAWLYAIPVEQLTDELTAVKLNLWALSIVSVWRVLLFSRVAGILFGIRFSTSLLWVLLPCMAAGIVGTVGQQFTIVPMMGGIEITKAQQIVLDYGAAVFKLLGFSLLPILIITPYLSGKKGWKP